VTDLLEDRGNVGITGRLALEKARLAALVGAIEIRPPRGRHNGNGGWSSSQTIPHRLNERQSGRVTHLCHPLNGYAFEPIRLFNSLGNLRVEF
jgi:hypothetical protein